MKVNLLYLSKPRYGGWVTFTCHLYHCIKKFCDPSLYRISKKHENILRDYGYGIGYQNISDLTLTKLDKEKTIITAIDKSYYDYLPLLKGCVLVIHDPTELSQYIIQNAKYFKIITIRKTVRDLLQKEYGIKSEFIYHPFYKYPVDKTQQEKNVSISRVDFDKHTEIILQANPLIKGEENKIKIYGSENRIYVFHKLKGMDYNKYYQGLFNRSFYAVNNILKNCKFVVDMSVIKKDGSGTQYTFLEAINNKCCLILNEGWFNGNYEVLRPQLNCLSAKDHIQLAGIINKAPKVADLISESQKILDMHDLKEIPYIGVK